MSLRGGTTKQSCSRAYSHFIGYEIAALSLAMTSFLLAVVGVVTNNSTPCVLVSPHEYPKVPKVVGDNTNNGEVFISSGEYQTYEVLKTS